MRIALVSDTHLPRFGRALPRALVDGLRETRVDLILHAGDWTEPMAVPLFEAIAPVDGVAGNNDGDELHARFGTRTVRRLEGFTVGVTHGHLGTGATTLDRARSLFAGQRLDVLVFGHSHRPHVERSADGTWLVNPGSPTDKRTQARYTWILLELAAGAAARAAPRRVRRPQRVALSEYRSASGAEPPQRPAHERAGTREHQGDQDARPIRRLRDERGERDGQPDQQPRQRGRAGIDGGDHERGDHQQPGGHPGGIVPGRSVHGGDEAARAEGDAEHGQPSDEVDRADPGRPAPAGGGHVSRGRCTRAGR